MAPLLTTAEAAERLGCTPQTVRNHVKADRLTPERKLATPTGTYLFRAEDVEALLSPAPTQGVA